MGRTPRYHANAGSSFRAGLPSSNLEQFRGTVVVARCNPEQHAKPPLPRRYSISRNHVDLRPRHLGDRWQRGTYLVRSLCEKGPLGPAQFPLESLCRRLEGVDILGDEVYLRFVTSLRKPREREQIDVRVTHRLKDASG